MVGAGKVREKGDVRDEEGNKGMARAGGMDGLWPGPSPPWRRVGVLCDGDT